jgi:hypothetical protein
MPTATSTFSSMYTSFASSTLAPSSTTTPSGVPKPKFNDTFVYVILAIVAILALLLFTMLAYLIFLYCRGQCPKCLDMKLQLDKWESGQLKRITKDMAKKREALNKHKSTTSSYASSDADIEMGAYPDRTSARSEALTQLEGRAQPSFWQNAKSKITGKGKSRASSRNPSPTPTNIDRFFGMSTIHIDGEDGDAPGPSGTYRIPSHPPQVSYQPSPALRHTTYSSSEYSQPTDSARASRIFADHTGSSFQPRGPLQKEADEPKSYTAYSKRRDSSPEIYNPRPKQLRIRLAEEALKSQEYKNAEQTLNRASTASYDMRRALSIVNFADLRVNMARHPSLYSEVDAGRAFHELPVLEQPVPEQPITDFRQDRQQAPIPAEVAEDFSGYLAKELHNP